VPGQGGEMHINEQEPSWWAKLFASQDYRMFDSIRMLVRRNKLIEPWYRYNAFLYANENGMKRMTANAVAQMIPNGQRPFDVSDVNWQLRRLIVRHLPVATVTALSKLNYRMRVIARRKRIIP
jgi:hypothetical protein